MRRARGETGLGRLRHQLRVVVHRRPLRPGIRAGDDERGARSARRAVLSHPDSHRRLRNSHRIGPRLAAGGSRAGPRRLPPVGTCTPTPRTFSCALRIHRSRPKLEHVLIFGRRSDPGRDESGSGASGGGRRRGGRGRGARRGGRPRGPRRRPTTEPGTLQTRAAPIAPQTPRDSIPNGRPSVLLAARIASARPGASRSIAARVPSGVRSRGPKPVPPVVTTRPAKPSVSSRRAPATESMPSATARRSTTSKPASTSRATSAAPERSSRVPAMTPSETVSTFASRAPRSALPAVDLERRSAVSLRVGLHLGRDHRRLPLGADRPLGGGRDADRQRGEQVAVQVAAPVGDLDVAVLGVGGVVQRRDRPVEAGERLACTPPRRRRDRRAARSRRRRRGRRSSARPGGARAPRRGRGR